MTIASLEESVESACGGRHGRAARRSAAGVRVAARPRCPKAPSAPRSRTHAAPGGWKVNAWVKRGILLGFRFGEIIDMSADHGRWPFFDKDTLPLKTIGAWSAVRIVPGGSTVRDGAWIGRGVICMPPMFVNIGAYVGDETLIDSHALVGSCAQIGSRVHLSAAAQIGGVIEPVGALPVIIEDDVLVGGNCGVYEGTIVKRRAVLAAGTILTASTPLYDLAERSHHRTGGRAAAGRARGGGRRAGHAAGDVRPGPRVGPLGRDAHHRQVPRRENVGEDGPRIMDTLAAVAFARTLIDIDSTTGREQEAGEWLASTPGAARLPCRSAARRRRPLQCLRAARRSGSRALDAFRLRPAVLSAARCAATRLFGRGSCDAKGILAAQVAAAEQMRARGERRIGLLFVVGEERGSDGAAVANGLAPGSAFLINGEPTDNRLGTATRGNLRLKLTASGRAAHSAAPEHGDSAIDKLLDTLIRMRQLPLARRSRAWGDVLYHRPDRRRRRAECDLAVGLGRNHVPYRRIAGRRAARGAAAWSRPSAIEEVLRVPMVRLHTVPGVPTAVFPFTTDVPLLDRWGTPLLYGPGSFLVAHTAEEHLAIPELEAAVAGYQALAAACLTSPAATTAGA